ncbi:MAG: UDP-N-acetylmuramate dehydrogenase, partial [Chloroflexi bacterium]|nr:UDP-N-acetylmuramate dehydrogenase [Chloroflexota bacterium]
EPESAGIDAETLVREIEEPQARFVASFEEAAEAAIELLRPGDVFFTIGAGDVDELGPLVIDRLQQAGAAAASKDYSALAAALAEITEVREHEPLSRHTTFGIGGPADVYVVAKNSDDLADIVIACREHDAPVFVLGSGSNIIVSDAGIRGVVIENRARAVSGPEPDGKGGFRFTAESGASFASVARGFARQGFAGLEWASGIPGTLGGAVVYNAGAYGGCLADVLESIRIVNGTGTARKVQAEELDLVYRGSSFTKGQYDNRVVLEAEFTLWRGDEAELMERVRDLDRRRLAAQPRGRNAGSIFKNTPEHPAWRMIDQVGLRGHRIGDAQISEQHCNFFINAGHATATDMKALIDLARERVRDKFGVELELEVGFVGEGFDG